MFASVLLTDGRLLTTVPARPDRVSIIKELVRDQPVPVFGFIVVFDAFLHMVTQNTNTAINTDAFIAHVGSESCRWSLTRPYHIIEGTVYWDAAPPDVDMRALVDRNGISQDPYAEVFVSTLVGVSSRRM